MKYSVSRTIWDHDGIAHNWIFRAQCVTTRIVLRLVVIASQVTYVDIHGTGRVVSSFFLDDLLGSGQFSDSHIVLYTSYFH